MFYAEIILPIPGGAYTYSCDAELVVGSVVSVSFGKKSAIGVVRGVSRVKPAFETKPVGEVLRAAPLVTPEQFRLWEWLAEYYMCTVGEVMRTALPTLLRKGDFQPYKRKKSQESRVRSQESGVKSHDSSLMTLPTLSAVQQAALGELLAAPQDVSLLFGVPSSGKSEVAFHLIARTLARGRDVLLLLPEISLSTQFVERVERVFGPEVILYHSALTDRRRADSYLQLLQSGLSIESPRPDAAPSGGLTHSFSPPPASGFRSGRLVVGTRSAIFLPFRDLGLVVVDEEQDSSYKQQDPAPRYNARDAAIVLAKFHNAKVVLASATPSLESWVNAGGGTQPAEGLSSDARLSALRSGGLRADDPLRRSKYALVRLTERYGATLPPQVVISDTLRAAKRGERRSHFNKELTDRIRTALADGRQVILFQNRRGVAPYIECEACGWVPSCGHCAIPLTVHRDSLRCHYCGHSEPLPRACPACGGSHQPAAEANPVCSASRQPAACPSRSPLANHSRPYSSAGRCALTPTPTRRAEKDQPLLGNGLTPTSGKPTFDACVGPSSNHRIIESSNPTLATRGFGTEKIEDELAVLFPRARVARLDGDSAASPTAYNRIIGGFEAGEIDILVGTQMVTKGLDFAGVSLVGVLNADNLLNYPDFRASERAYQLIAQVAGRAGRRDVRGEVVIQTAAAGNPIIGWAAAGDYRSMAAEVLSERSTYGYPPYARLISVMLRHWDGRVLNGAARLFGEALERELAPEVMSKNQTTGNAAATGATTASATEAAAASKTGKTTNKATILGPQPPVTERVKGEYALIYLLKIPRTVPLTAVRSAIRTAAKSLVADPKFRRTIIVPNVDPQ